MSYDEIISQLENLKGHCVDMSKGDCEEWKKDVQALTDAIEIISLLRRWFDEHNE